MRKVKKNVEILMEKRGKGALKRFTVISFEIHQVFQQHGHHKGKVGPAVSHHDLDISVKHLQIDAAWWLDFQDNQEQIELSLSISNSHNMVCHGVP